MDLQKFFDVSQSADLDTFRQQLVGFAHDMGFQHVSGLFVVERPGRQVAARWISNHPDLYKDVDQDVDDVKRDPVVHRMKRLSVPFIYDQDVYVGEDAADLWEKQAPFGFKTGVAVPLHLPSYKHFVLSVDRNEPLPDDVSQMTRIMADLQLLAVHAQSAAERLLSPKEQPLPEGAVLTTREVEVLRWTMEGKSAWAVGEILSISENTVNFHLRNVFRKLDASSKHQAVLKAMALGLL
jgi:DNA-binding CsgD family transcriptional regulator